MWVFEKGHWCSCRVCGWHTQAPFLHYILDQTVLPWSLHSHGVWVGKREDVTAAHLLVVGEAVKRVRLTSKDMSQHSCSWQSGPRASNAEAMEKVASS